ncbi:hypothetical protein ABZ642_43410 [Streptomyces sp. NPDC007157]
MTIGDHLSSLPDGMVPRRGHREYDLEGVRRAVLSLIGFPDPGSPGVR